MNAETGPPKSPPETTDARRDQREPKTGSGNPVTNGLYPNLVESDPIVVGEMEAMTTYQYTLSIGESEQLALEAALELMIQHCREQITVGIGAPYRAHQDSCTEMLRKLRRTPAELTSTSSGSWPGSPL